MKGQGPRSERETVIRFDEAGDTATVWTASEVVYRRLRKMGYEPVEDRERSANFKVPKGDVRLPRPKRTRSPSKRTLENLRKARESRQKAYSSSGASIGSRN